ncbi:hypothetical protein H9N25_13695 [Pedobacter riviphilus]|uniref:SUKH-4 immunity protein n=1 Tax=Pedobacter riviphilus TaxID=2766984 RepID=A0ABX6TF70_9SPHI|nr:hypothetical protein [Pedobacter riviphilus]QNR83030.1 hypothetical protein H9N25_13695 [Pedobacter riviphilus]
MISTKNLSLLPDRTSLENICKAISVLDAIICQEWQYRYYSFYSNWGPDEQCLQMRNGSGEEIHILFLPNGCAINGTALDYKQQDKTKLTANLPAIFNEFVFGEPVASLGTTFCIWTTEPKNWQVGQLENIEDHSGEMLSIFDGDPQTYVDWATDYFEGSYKASGIPLETASKIYSGQTLTKEMVLSIVEELEDWEQLETDLKEISYPYNFK